MLEEKVKYHSSMTCDKLAKNGKPCERGARHPGAHGNRWCPRCGRLERNGHSRYTKCANEGWERRWAKNPRRKLLLDSRYRAKKAGIPFDLTLDDIPQIPLFCPIFPWIALEVSLGKKHGRDNSPSIDRIRPNLGYTKGNIRITSWKANRLRNNATLKELESLVIDARSCE